MTDEVTDRALYAAIKNLQVARRYLEDARNSRLSKRAQGHVNSAYHEVGHALDRIQGSPAGKRIEKWFFGKS